MFGHSARAGKSLAGMAIIAVVALGAAGGGALIGPKLMRHKPAGGTAEAKSASHESSLDEKTQKPHETAEKGEAKEAVQAPAAPVVDLGEFLVNLDGAEARYLRAEVAVRLSPPETEKKKKGGHGGGHGGDKEEKLPTADIAVARDCITTVLSSGVFETLRTTAGRARLKETVLAKLQEALPQYEVHEVLFTSFVMQ